MKSQQIKFVVFIVVAAVLAISWIVVGTDENEVPYISIEELYADQFTGAQQRFRLGGMVETGSIIYSADRLNVDFVIVQGNERLPVHYSGLTPDLFVDSAEVIIEGEYLSDVFLADNLMTKCASHYEVE